jgi:hypothetical protein
VPFEVRAIDYAVFPSSELERWGFAPTFGPKLGEPREVGVMNCVCWDGSKVHLVGPGGSVLRFVRHGPASDPGGFQVPPEVFPIIGSGWAAAS